ncbi:MAG: transglycosylase domain-containing protein, partial [bacterium]|nr:transglycosylase domain-containing protein [bacterium]
MKILFLYFIFYVLSALFPLPDYKLERDYSTVYLDRNNELLRISISPSGKFRVKLPLDEISKYIQKGFILYEDRYFYLHPGINPAAILRAFCLNSMHQKIISGGSTISMQIARMMEPRPRTVLSKVLEMFRAFQLEMRYAKPELLEIYLNTIPFGANIEGVGAASYFYFGKSAKDLSLAESCLLIAIPNSPNRNNPRQDPLRAKTQRDKVIGRIGPGMGLKTRILETLKKRPLPGTYFPNPFRTPHLIEANKPCWNRFFRKFTIDLNIQTYCEELLKESM